MENNNVDNEETVYVHPLTSNVTTEHVREIFGHFGKLKNVEFKTLEKEGSTLSYGVVEFEKHEDAKYSVLHLNDGEIDGVKVKVGFKKPRS